MKTEAEVTTEQIASLFKQMTDLEKSIKFWQKFNGKYERSSVVDMRHRRSQLLAHLESGETLEATNLYRDFFRDFEINVTKYLAGDHSAELTKVIGENYGEYNFTRSLLENLSQNQENQHLRVAAQSVLNNLEPASIARMFPGIGLPKERPSANVIKDIFRSSPQMMIAKLKKDLAAEKKMGFKTVALGLMHLQNLMKMVYKVLPIKFRQPVSQLIGLSYNSYVLTKFLPDIERIILMPDNAEIRAENLREINAKYPKGDEFLVTFVRIPQMTKTWEAMKADVRSRAEVSQIYARFLERMNQAEITADKLGDLPRFEQSSVVDRFAPAILPAVTLTYLTTRGEFSMHDAMTGLQQLLLSLGGG